MDINKLEAAVIKASLVVFATASTVVQITLLALLSSKENNLLWETAKLLFKPYGVFLLVTVEVFIFYLVKDARESDSKIFGLNSIKKVIINHKIKIPFLAAIITGLCYLLLLTGFAYIASQGAL